MTQTVLTIKDLAVEYGKVPAVTGVDLVLRKGQIVSIIGPNGAGKSSALNAVMGILPPHATMRGAMSLQERAFHNVSVEQRVASGLSLVPERRELFGTMTVLENLTLGAHLRKKLDRVSWLDQLEVVFELFPRLKERSGQLAGTLSGGERQMLALGRALMVKPIVLMLDEPSLGLAPLVVKEVLQAVAALRDSGMSILLVEQNARAALEISDFAYVLEGGRVSLSGAASDLASDARVVNAYLGVGGMKLEQAA